MESAGVSGSVTVFLIFHGWRKERYQKIKEEFYPYNVT